MITGHSDWSPPLPLHLLSLTNRFLCLSNPQILFGLKQSVNIQVLHSPPHPLLITRLPFLVSRLTSHSKLVQAYHLNVRSIVPLKATATLSKARTSSSWHTVQGSDPQLLPQAILTPDMTLPEPLGDTSSQTSCCLLDYRTLRNHSLRWIQTACIVLLLRNNNNLLLLPALLSCQARALPRAL